MAVYPGVINVRVPELDGDNNQKFDQRSTSTSREIAFQQIVVSVGVVNRGCKNCYIV